MQRRPLILALCSLALLLLAVGCGEESPERQLERAFLSAIVPHHECAIEMAEAAQRRPQDRRLREIQDPHAHR